MLGCEGRNDRTCSRVWAAAARIRKTFERSRHRLELSDALAVAGIDADVEAVARLGTEYERFQAELDAAYARWEELSDQLTATAAG